MIFELKLLLFIYYGFLVVWFLFSLIALYHMFRFGFKGITSLVTVIIYIAVSFLLSSVSFNYINYIDWDTEIEIFKWLGNNIY